MLHKDLASYFIPQEQFSRWLNAGASLFSHSEVIIPIPGFVQGHQIICIHYDCSGLWGSPKVTKIEYLPPPYFSSFYLKRSHQKLRVLAYFPQPILGVVSLVENEQDTPPLVSFYWLLHFTGKCVLETVSHV